MDKINAIIVEDDPFHQENLVQLLKEIEPDLTILGLYTNVNDAYSAIQSKNPQLVFLDIDLDYGETGFDLLQKFENPGFAVIFTTQHNSQNMIVRALRASAADYLTKPIIPGELKNAIGKSIIDFTKIQLLAIKSNTLKPDMQITSICISSTEGKLLIPVSIILYAESNNVYTNFFLEKPIANKSRILSSESIKFWESTLKNSSVLRIHNEYLLNTIFIKSFSKKLSGGGDVKLINGLKLPVSKSRLIDLKSRISLS